jgi:protein TonB
MATRTATLVDSRAPLQRRRSDRRGDGKAARDRLVSMLVLTALLHGLLILGVTFGPLADEGSPSRGLEVLLVSDELPEARSNDTATYLAQRTQLGSGNTEERVAARIPGAAPGGGAPAARTAAAKAAEQAAASELLATLNPRARVVFSAPPQAEDSLTDPSQNDLPLLLGEGEGPLQPQSLDAAADLALRGRKRDELYVTADTRASDLAPYLDAWRRRVERIGTLNYPSAAQRRGLKGNPVIEVIIRRDGKLDSATIRQSSGHPEIDAAALDILKLSSPFDAFPPALAGRYRVLHFAYEWQFVGGALGQGNVSVP